MQTSEAILSQYFGYESFRPNQHEAIEVICKGKDVFVLMPTGGGKSLCYSVPSVMMSGMTVVISPLISLMKDQVDSLNHNGIAAAFINSSLDLPTQQSVIQRMEQGELSMIYVAPERLLQPYFLDKLRRLDINFFAIDEAHCISQWGHDFRPDYRQLSRLRQHFPETPIMALTATATDRVKKDIVGQLGLKSPEILTNSFFRSNLKYAVRPKQGVKEEIRDYILNRPSQSGIVYCQSRSRVENLTEYLQNAGIRAKTYHAGLSNEDRMNHQELFKSDEVQVIVATIAFGMGIDKPDIRFVLHESVPRSLEHYYQETGRAGRDGLPSDCVLFFSSGDLQLYRQFNQKLPPEEQVAAGHKLDQVQRFCLTSNCRHHMLLEYFSEERIEKTCQSCDNCLHPVKTFDATELCQKILSCIARLDRPYSPTYISNILIGKSDENIQRRQHDVLNVFGLITEYSAAQLRQIILELSYRGFININSHEYNSVTLMPAGVQVLKGQVEVELSEMHLPRIKPVKSRPSSRKSTASTKEQQGTVDGVLFQKLRATRKQIASEEGMPPYIIFADTSLHDMAAKQPITLAEFANIFGVGQKKLDQYGQRFIDVIKTHTVEN